MRLFILLVLLITLASRASTTGDDEVYPMKKHLHHKQYISYNNLTASAFHYSPYFIISRGKDGSPTYSGYCFDILKAISHHLKIGLNFVPINRSEVAKHGMRQAIINQLVLSKEVEITPMALIQTEQRTRLMSFTFPVLIGQNRLMLRYPEEESRLKVIVRPFTYWTWILCGTAIIVLLGTMVFVIRYQYHWSFPANKDSQLVSLSIWGLIGWNWMIILRIIIGQGVYIRYCRSIFLFLIGIWSLASVVISNAYTSTLTSFMMTEPKLKSIANSLEELAASDHYKFTAEFNAVYTDIFLKATSGYYKTLGDSLRQNPQFIYRDYDQATENVLERNAVYIRGSIDVLTRIHDDMRANHGQCRLTASKPMGNVEFLSLGMAKNNPNKKIIDQMITQFTEAGLLKHWLSQYVPYIEKCLLTSNHVARLNKKKINSLNLNDLSYIFLLLTIGYSVSCIAFLYELFVSL